MAKRDDPDLGDIFPGLKKKNHKQTEAEGVTRKEGKSESESAMERREGRIGWKQVILKMKEKEKVLR